MALLPLTFSDSSFPDPFSGTQQDLVQAFVDNLTATVNENNLLLGQIGGTKPITDVGIWLDTSDGSIWVWDGAAYTPATVKLGNATDSITLSAGTLTADRTILLPDEDGTVALLSDIYVPRPTIVVTGAAPSLDWSATETFFLSMPNSDVLATIANSVPSQTVRLVATNSTGSTHQMGIDGVTWATLPTPNTGLPPLIPTAQTWMMELTNDAGTTYGRVIGANYS